MRRLTVKQKNILKKFKDCRDVDELPYEIWEKLQEINDTEILWQEVNRFLGDQFIKERHERKSFVTL